MDCNAKPQAEHAWLDQLVGEWTFEAEATMGPDQPAMKTKGTESVRSVGGFWIIAEGEGEMPKGGRATMMLTLGYDPAKGKYVGSWLGSMMPLMFVYEGQLDDAQRILTLSTRGPSFTDPTKQSDYRDVIEIVDKNHRILHSRVPTPDGGWMEFMTAHYRRK